MALIFWFKVEMHVPSLFQNLCNEAGVTGIVFNQ
jgi:hypothetical protein